MGKKYVGKKMMKKSRFVKFFKTMPQSEKDAVSKRIDELVVENAKYCDKGNFGHLCNIFSAMALFEQFQKSGKSKDDSLQMVSEIMWNFVENGTAKKYRKVFGLPGVLKLLGKMLPKLFAKGSGYGWEYTWHTESATDKFLKFECTSCIYAQIFSKYSMQKLGPIFCHCDDINYGKISGMTFTRKHTLCTDGEPCDFLFVKEKREKNTKRKIAKNLTKN